MANFQPGIDDVFQALADPTRWALVASRLAEAEAWLAAQRALWEARSDRLVEFVERRHQEEQDVSKPRRTR
ncbi:hypothetical protein [Burkholderia pyrrocinia]